MPAIDKALHGKMVYNQMELKFVLQQFHRHRRESWKISLDANKLKLDKKRKGMNSKRSDVGSPMIYRITYRSLFIYYLFHFIFT
jgi:hypothetical protein